MIVLPVVYVGDLARYTTLELSKIASAAMLLTSHENVRSVYQQFIASGLTIPTFLYDPLDMDSRDAAETVALLVTNYVVETLCKGVAAKLDTAAIYDGLFKHIPLTFSIAPIGDCPAHFPTPNWRFFEALDGVFSAGNNPAGMRLPLVTVYELMELMELAGIRVIDNTQRYLRNHRKALQEACASVVKHLDDLGIAGLQTHCRQIVEGAKHITDHRVNTQAIEEILQDHRKTTRSLKTENEALQAKIGTLNQTIFDKDNEIKGLMARVKNE